MPTCRELRETAKALGIRRYSVAKKSELIELISNHPTAQTNSETEAAPAPKEVPRNEDLEPNQRDAFVQAKYGDKAVKPQKAVKRTANAWNTFLRHHSKEKGISHKAAMQCKDEYQVWKEKHWNAETRTVRE